MVDSALTTTDKRAPPCSAYSSRSCRQPRFTLAFLLLVQAVGSKTCFECPEMQPFLKWPCLCVTLNVVVLPVWGAGTGVPLPPALAAERWS